MFRGYLVKDSRWDAIKETALYFIQGTPIWNKGYASWRQNNQEFKSLDISEVTSVIQKPKEYVILTVEEYEELISLVGTQE